MDLTSEITTMAKSAGASLVGVASVDRFDGAPQGHHPCALLPGARAVVTFGIRILDRVLEWPDLLEGSPFFPESMRKEALHKLFYLRSGYDVINDRLNDIALTLANFLEDGGHRSLYFPATYGHLAQTGGMAQVPGMLSQRHAAVRAGLGEFGLNNVVITERYGPRIRFNSVVTAAELVASPLAERKICTGVSCSLCVTECGPGAIRVLPSASDERVWLDPVSRTDWGACREHREPMACAGRCLRVCPVGRS